MKPLASFPEPIDGELVYGLLGRHRALTGSMPAAAHSAGLFGRSAAVATFDLPGGLARLAAVLPPRLALGTDALLGRTLLPYYAAHQTTQVRSAVTSELATGTSPAAHNRLGVNAFAIRPHDALRFCPGCVRAQVASFGEATWLAVAQAPGVAVCADHGCMIVESAVTRAMAGRHGYLRPADAVLRAERVAAPKDAVFERLAAIAADVGRLWSDPPPPTPLEGRRDACRSRLEAIGLMRSPGKVDMRGLVGAFRAYWGDAFEYLPAACRVPDEGGWLASITRTHRKAFHPLLQVMLDRFIVDAPAAPAIPGPFGAGPWPCRNVLAEHHGLLQPMRLAVHRESYGHVGTFTCRCGYVYTRAARSDGILGPPRLANAGSLLAPALRRLVVPGAGLRAVAREVGMDPKTTVREALALGIDVPWTTKPSGRPPTATPSAVVIRHGRPARTARARRDWPARDRELVGLLHAAARDIAKLEPPVRAALSELERRVARTGYFAKRRAKLPLSLALLQQLTEDVETFQRRRAATGRRASAPPPAPGG